MSLRCNTIFFNIYFITTKFFTMKTLKTAFGIIHKLDNNTFILPANLTGKKLLQIQKLHRDFFASFVIIPLTEKEKTQKMLSEKNQMFLSSFFLTITRTVPEKTIFFMFGVILSFVLISFLVALILEYRKKQKEITKISFNDTSKPW